MHRRCLWRGPEEGEQRGVTGQPPQVYALEQRRMLGLQLERETETQNMKQVRDRPLMRR